MDRAEQDGLKSQQGVLCHLLGRKPHWTDLYQNLCGHC